MIKIDTFIALRGLLLLTKRYNDAKQHLLKFAAAMRHSLVFKLYVFTYYFQRFSLFLLLLL